MNRAFSESNDATCDPTCRVKAFWAEGGRNCAFRQRPTEWKWTAALCWTHSAGHPSLFPYYAYGKLPFLVILLV